MCSMTRLAAVVAALAALTVLTGCGAPSEEHADQTAAKSSAEAAEEAPDNHNGEDVAFLQNMIPHHEQALDLTALAPKRTDNAQLRDLAAKIADEQEPEIQGFRAQLLQWELPVAPGVKQHPHMKVDGMVDPATMDKLKSLHGTEFDTLWLHSMIAHHRGAMKMAHNEIKHGQSPDAISMAKNIVSTQQEEIDQMNQMLGG